MDPTRRPRSIFGLHPASPFALIVPIVLVAIGLLATTSDAPTAHAQEAGASILAECPGEVSSTRTGSPPPVLQETEVTAEPVGVFEATCEYRGPNRGITFRVNWHTAATDLRLGACLGQSAGAPQAVVTTSVNTARPDHVALTEAMFAAAAAQATSCGAERCPPDFNGTPLVQSEGRGAKFERLFLPDGSREQLEVSHHICAYRADGPTSVFSATWNGFVTPRNAVHPACAGAPSRISSEDRQLFVTSPSDDVEAEAELVLAFIALVDHLAQPCPAGGEPPGQQATDTPEATTEATATAEATPPAVCAPSGRVTDGQDRPVAGIRIELRFRGAVRQSVATGADGRWAMVTIGTTTAEDFDPALDPVEILLVAKDEEHDPRWFELRYGAAGEIPHIRFGPVFVEDLAAPLFNCQVDFELSLLGPEDSLYEPFVGPTSYDDWDDLLEIYTNLRNVWQFGTNTLGVTMDFGLPLSVYTFCTVDTPATNEQCRRSRTAFWNGTNTIDTAPREPLIGFGVSTSDSNRNSDHPVNREYHEFGHALLADAFDNQIPRVTGFGTNHGGLYANGSSNDSFNEGFAEFFAAMASKEIDANSQFFLYPLGRSPQPLEDDWRVWDTNGDAEEWAVAGVLLDFVDGDGDYTQARQGTVEVLQSTVVEHVGAAPGEPGFLIATLVRNDRNQALPAVAVQVRLDGRTEPLIGVSGRLEPGQSEVVFIPLPDGVSTRGARTEAFTLVAGDDDPLTVGLRQLWDVILAAPSSHPDSNGHIVDVSELYEALFVAFNGDRDGDGRDDVDEIFIAHGFYADTAGGASNRRYDEGEAVGLSSYRDVPRQGSVDPRTAGEPVPAYLATFDAGGVNAHVQVQVIYDEPFLGRSYSYELAPDEDGTVEVAVPPPDQPASVHVIAVAEGHLPALIASWRSDAFWEAAEANGFQPFLALEADLQEGELFADEDGGGSSLLIIIVATAAAIAALVVAALAARRFRGARA